MSSRHTPTASGLHPVHAILLSFPVALFVSGLLTDLAYLNTAVVQWSNFSAWLITGALAFGALVLVWAIVLALFPGRLSRSRALGFLTALAVMMVAGLVNAFQHSHDGWSAVGALGLVLSLVCAGAALAAAVIGFSNPGAGR